MLEKTMTTNANIWFAFTPIKVELSSLINSRKNLPREYVMV
jgi:hypothetical protein